MQVEISDQNGKDQKSQTGADAAAFARDLYVDPSQVKDEAIAEHRHAAPVEENCCNFRGSFLQQVNYFIKNKIRDRNGEQKKDKWESRALKCPPAEEESKTSRPNQNKSE